MDPDAFAEAQGDLLREFADGTRYEATGPHARERMDTAAGVVALTSILLGVSAVEAFDLLLDAPDEAKRGMSLVASGMNRESHRAKEGVDGETG